eukprot:1137800-Pelagomonas_calceolata.AAC.4
MANTRHLPSAQSTPAWTAACGGAAVVYQSFHLQSKYTRALHPHLPARHWQQGHTCCACRGHTTSEPIGSKLCVSWPHRLRAHWKQAADMGKKHGV